MADMKIKKVGEKHRSILIPALSDEAKIKRKLRVHLKSLGYRKNAGGKLIPPDLTKNGIRILHAQHRIEKLTDSQKFLEKNAEKCLRYFASGNEVNPINIRPRLELVNTELQSAIFRSASLTWSVPVSVGYGRRMRFLVWDDSNDKLIGIFALGDPVFNLKVRDNYIGWDHIQRKTMLANMMDAYVLGAVPPYNMLLGGKLVASLIRSSEVEDYFSKKYRDAVGVISNERKKPRLVVVTTTSSMGKSSIYNRLRLDGTQIFKPIGYTGGWGHFHIPDELFADMRDFLEKKGHRYASNHQFGEGPNWRLRTVRAALKELKINEDILCHGIPREVFICEMAENATSFLHGRDKKPRFCLPSSQDIANLALERWVLPRAERRQEYLHWRKEQIYRLFETNHTDEEQAFLGFVTTR